MPSTVYTMNKQIDLHVDIVTNLYGELIHLKNIYMDGM